jgi:glycosyltransferase involved in cell wall biosynthesis
MARNLAIRKELRIIWVYSGSLATDLSAATWLSTVHELRHIGCHVTLVAVGPTSDTKIRGVELICIPRPEIYLLRQIAFHIRVLLLILRQWLTTDIILFHEFSAFWILPLRIARQLTGVRRPALVMDTRSLPMPHPANATWKDKVRKGAYRMQIWLGNRYADGRLAITQRMSEAVDIPAERLWGTWPSGADVKHFARARMDRCWPLSGAPIHLIHHGSLHFERNLLTLCKAVAKANAEGMSFELRLIGDGTARTELEVFAAQSDGAIQLAPPMPYEKIPKELAGAHIGVLPFPDEEKFRVCSPIKLFEYMAAGLPILATRIVCHTDVVGGGDFAFWAEAADEQGILDALHLIWRSRDSLSGMGQLAAFAAEEWTWAKSAGKLKEALEKGYQSHISPTEFYSL